MIRPSGFVYGVVCLLVAVPLCAGASWPFEENGGRFDPIVGYVTRTSTSDVFVTNDGKVVHSLRGKDGARWSLVETMEGATRPLAGKNASAPIHLFRGATSRKLQTFETVRFASHAGIASELRLRDGGVERLFELAPGVRASDVRVRFAGATKLALAADGGIRVSTGVGDLKLSAPIAWQVVAGKTVPVAIAYRLERNGYSFRLGKHDPKLPVIIDPLLQSTYVGGGGSEAVQAITTTANRVYVAGGTSGSFPGVAGGAQTTYGGGALDVFVAAYSVDLTTLIQATYFGGDGQDVAWTIAATDDAVYVGGLTESTNLPGSATGAITAYAGGLDDGFLARFSLDLTLLVRSTYFGGGGHDMIRGLAVSGNVIYATGLTDSTAPAIPGTAGSAQPAMGGPNDAFVARFSTDLTTLQRATFLGGSLDDSILSDPVVTADSVYVAGATTSHDFPNVAGGVQSTIPAIDASINGFVTRLNLDLTQNVQSTYYFTDFSHEQMWGIAAGFGDIFISGHTAGDGLPGTDGGAFPDPDNLADMFVARLSPTLTSVVNATYYGGFEDESAAAHGLVITSSGVFITGATGSANLPGTTGAIQETKMQPADITSDVFVAGFTPDLATLTGATYLGSPINEWPNAMAARGNVLYVAGSEDFTDFPGTTGGAQEEFGGGQGYDGFIAALTPDLLLVGPTPNVSISDVSLAEGNGGSTLFQFTVSLDVAPSSNATVTVASANGTAVAPGDFLSLVPTQLTFTPFGSLSQTVTVQVSGDFEIEGDEQFTMVLSSPNGMTIADGTGVGTIINDDAVGPASIPIPTASESMLIALVVLIGALGALTLRS